MAPLLLMHDEFYTECSSACMQGKTVGFPQSSTNIRPTWCIHTDYKVCMHRAPEQVDAEFGSRGPHTDVWDFATCLLHLATAQQPYKDLTMVQMVTAMTKGRPPAVPPTLPAWLQHLLTQCLSFDIPARPSVLQLLQVKLG